MREAAVPAAYPARFSAADRALHEALRRLDPLGVVEALMAGADMEKPDAEGSTALFVLLHAAYRVETRSEDASAAACAEALMSRGADAWAMHLVPDECFEELCRSREYDCRDCPGESAPVSFAPYGSRQENRCSGNAFYEFIAFRGGSFGDAPLFVETMDAWIDRHMEDRKLRPLLLEGLRRECEGRAILDASEPPKGGRRDGGETPPRAGSL